MTKISLKSTILSLIESIDLFNYLLKNHHRRTAIIASNLAKSIDLPPTEYRNLIFAASLHDIGALTVEERDRLIELDVQNPRQHEIIGAAMLGSFSPFKGVAAIINHHHIRYDERDTRFAYENIPKACYLLHLADRIDILIDPGKPVLSQVPVITEAINEYKDSLFAPWAVEAFNQVSKEENFWFDIDYKSLDYLFNELDFMNDDDFFQLEDLEDLSLMFARIVDYRSSFTAAHSVGVGAVAYELSKLLNLDENLAYQLKIAGYLHDIGKIAIPTEIIEKKGPLTEEEYTKIKLHSYYTFLILSRISGLEQISKWASRHHEKHDGSGYPYHITSEKFSIEVEIVAYSDIFTSLCETRPYRDDLDKNHILDIMRAFSTSKLSSNVYEIIESNFDMLDQVRKVAQSHTLLAYRNEILAS